MGARSREAAAAGRSFAPVEMIPRRWKVVGFPGGATLENPDDRIDFARLAIGRMAVQQEGIQC